jgi:xanthine/uracil permease
MLAVYGMRIDLSFCGSLNEAPFQVSTAMEAIGDITASAEVSRLRVEGDEFDSRIQGGILVRDYM